MTQRQRMFHVVTVMALLGSLLFALAPFRPTFRAQAQDDDSAVAPRGPGGGPPEGLAAELLLGETRFLFDRILPLDPADLTAVAQTDESTIYASSDQPPFDRVFVALSTEDNAGLARYLPETLLSDDDQCLSESANLASVDAGESGIFVFAGLEPDLTPDLLQEGGTTSDGATFYIGTEDPFEEFFVNAPDGLQRFVRTDDQGLPAILTGEVPFAGRLFTFAGAADTTDDLIRIGCAGPFPLFVTSGDEATPEELVVVVAGQALTFTATGDDADTMTAEVGTSDSEQGTEEADATPPAEDPTSEPDDGAESNEATPADETSDTSGDEEQDVGTPDTEQATEEADASPPAELPTTQPDDGGASDEATPDDEPADASAVTEFPREITIDDARYLLDRVVPVAIEDVTEISQQDGLTVYARSEEEPLDRVYVVIMDGDDQVARYLSETPDAGCLAQTASYSVLDAGDAGQFVFAGVETDITPDDLQEVGTTPDDQTIYAGDEQPTAEFFIAGDEGLLRFVLLDEQGLPSNLDAEFPFAGQTLAFEEAVTNVDINTLNPVGCAGPFPVLAAEAAESPFTELFLSVGDQVLLFRAIDGSAAATAELTETVEASPEVVEEPTETPAPTEAPTETQVPTETLVPTEQPTEAPTETLAPTETPVPTEAPTETPAPTETVAPTETPVPAETVAATEAPTEPAPPPTETAEAVAETPVPTETATVNVQVTATEKAAPSPVTTDASPEAASPTPVPPTAQPTAAPPAELPAQIEVQNTSYVFTNVETSINISVLVQVEVIEVQSLKYTVYAEQNVQGVAVRLFCVSEDGRFVGRYVPAATSQPAPPPNLPTTVDVRGVSYVFNEVEVNVDIQTLVQIEVVQVQNIKVTIYAEPNVQSRPVRLFCVSEDGQVIGQYIDVTVIVKAKVTIKTGTFQPATAATLPPNAPPAAAGTSIPSANPCAGDVGPLDDRRMPRRLPRRIQLAGTSYSYSRINEGDIGTLTRVGCVGGYEALRSDREDGATVIFLRIAAASAGQSTLFRFEAITTISVSVEVKGQPRTITLQPAPDQEAATYSVRASWQRSIYSSVTVLLYAEDPESTTPALLYGYDVDADVFVEYVPEGEIQDASPEVQEAAEALGLNPDLVLAVAGGQRYILVGIWEPAGSTANGWVTFYAVDGDDTSQIVLGRDPRQPDLLIFQRTGATGG